MERTKQQVCLLKISMDNCNYMIWVGTQNQPMPGYPGHAILCDTNKESLQVPLNEPVGMDAETKTTLNAISEAFKSSTDRNCIEMFMVPDKHSNSLKLAIRMMFDLTLVQSLKNLLLEPKITIEGVIWMSGFQYPFQVSGLPLQTIKYDEGIEGASKIIERITQYSGYSLHVLTYSIILEWHHLKMTTPKIPSIVLDKLFSEKLLTDCSILTANQTEVSCHRNVLAANSDVLHAMLTSGLQESQTNKIDMTRISEEVINLLLSFMYGREINTAEIKKEIAFELLCAAHKYNMSSLQELMMVTLFNKPNDSFNMTTVLDLYFFTLNVEEFSELCEKMLNILKSNPKKLLASTVYQDLLETSPKDASKLALKLPELVIG